MLVENLQKLSLRIKSCVPTAQGGMELAFDSTGVNVYGTSGWHQRKHGNDGKYRKREQWKKIHVALDLATMQVLSVEYTSSDTNDCEVIEALCQGIRGNVTSVRADGAYDTKAIYERIERWGAQALIPPSRTSRAQEELVNRPKQFSKYLLPRDHIIKQIRAYDSFDEGLKQWKQSSGYHRRSLIESFMSRFKKTFGFNLQHKREDTRRNEIIAKINLLNRMAVV